MRVLIQGAETIDSIDSVLSGTRIRSDAKKQALYDHFCKGINKSAAAALNNVNVNKFDELVQKIHKVAIKAALSNNTIE